MSDYRESTDEARSWRRAVNVQIFNPLEGDKYIVFGEEDVITIGEKVVRTPAARMGPADPGVRVTFSPDSVIQLLDPTTGEEIPGATMTHLQLYVALYSAYIRAAMVRDQMYEEEGA
jgi:hypothetical protein